MTLVPACSGWVSRLDQRISLIIMGIIINTLANPTPIKEVVVEVAVVDKEDINLTKAEAEVKVKGVVVADGVMVMPTVTPYTRKLMRK
jgi:hypothetical protein